MSILDNYVFIVSFFGWCVAQVLKTILDLISNKKFSLERVLGAGGMPSSHSSCVCAMSVSVYKVYGFLSPIFAIALVVSIVVMFDAAGVRKATGDQSKVLNIISEYILSSDNSLDLEKQNILRNELKENVGHTLIEVFAGLLLGVGIGFVIPIF